MIRPELARDLRRLADLWVALVVLGLGLWAAFGTYGVLRWLGWALVALGVALAWVALQRARFARNARADGPGIVQVVEGEIRHFGPHDGAFIALEDIEALHLSPDGTLWLIDTLDGQRRAIPRAAQGAQGLFDAFATLPDLGIEHLLRIGAQAPFERTQRVWTRPPRTRLPRS